MRHKVFGWVLGGAISFGAGPAAEACAFHGYVPDPTLVDLLLATEQIMVARPDPGDPTRYQPIRVLLGPETAQVPVAVSAATRARLSDKTTHSVLLARDGAYGPWQELAVLDDRFRGVVDHVVAHQIEWSFGADAERLSLFSGYLNDPNPDLRRLALQELDRVPYGVLRAARLPKIPTLKQDLQSGDSDLLPIRVLLAGLSQDPSFGAVLAQDLDAAIAQDLPYLGAYATAWIELDGKTAAQAILDRLAQDDALSLNTRIKLLEALALQHTHAPAPTRRVIARGVAEMLRSRPDLREAATTQFGFGGGWASSGQEPAGKPLETDR
ncbi:MAG: hypothetical protein AAFN80_01295 [Pseudomonadota bacterium]